MKHKYFYRYALNDFKTTKVEEIDVTRYTTLYNNLRNNHMMTRKFVKNGFIYTVDYYFFGDYDVFVLVKIY